DLGELGDLSRRCVRGGSERGEGPITGIVALVLPLPPRGSPWPPRPFGALARERRRRGWGRAPGPRGRAAGRRNFSPPPPPAPQPLAPKLRAHAQRVPPRWMSPAGRTGFLLSCCRPE